MADIWKSINTMRNMSFGRLLRFLFFEDTRDSVVQLFRYLFVGGFAATVDMGSLFVFTSILNIHYVISVALSFVLGNVTNYMLSIRWIFASSGNRKFEFTLFTLIGIGGLGLTELIIWLLVEQTHLYYMLAKLVSVALVVVWSFGMRKLLFDKLGKRSATRKLAAEA